MSQERHRSRETETVSRERQRERQRHKHRVERDKVDIYLVQLFLSDREIEVGLRDTESDREL